MERNEDFTPKKYTIVIQEPIALWIENICDMMKEKKGIVITPNKFIEDATEKEVLNILNNFINNKY